MLKNLEINKTIQKLHTILQQEKLYLDEELTLAILAKKIDISQHQLSIEPLTSFTKCHHQNLKAKENKLQFINKVDHT